MARIKHTELSPSRAVIVVALSAVLSLTGCNSDDDDCTAPPPPDPTFSHAEHFAENPYVGPNMNTACIGCHLDTVQHVMQSGHWNWAGESVNLAGFENENHGKQDLINNFCIAIPSNEGRCTVCHIGVGYADETFDFNDPAGVDCLVCHDNTGTYVKGTTTAGRPVDGLDWVAIGAGIGMPGREQCGSCHYSAGGGDNVKHGDLAVNLNETTREYDVHMGIDGANFACQECHRTDAQHGIGGMPLHSVDEGDMQACADCHDGPLHTAAPLVEEVIRTHPTLSCQVCHIPAIARFRSTKTEWYWATAGDPNRVPQDVGDGRFDYDRKKGDFVWSMNVRPTLRRHDGSYNRTVIGVSDTYTQDPTPEDPVVLGEPAAPKDPALAGATRIYPFKKMVGNQPADPVNKRVIVPHLFGTKGGPNPYWGRFDWSLALSEGAAYTGVPFSGTYSFVDTVMYLAVNHEVGPRENALGRGGCFDCHGLDATTGEPQIDWSELGRTDPLGTGGN